jgi:hypothetical protein
MILSWAYLLFRVDLLNPPLADATRVAARSLSLGVLSSIATSA